MREPGGQTRAGGPRQAHNFLKETAMETTTPPTGKLRKSLSEQIDRLDAILDGRSNALNESVATAVKQAVGQAVREAVEAVLAGVLPTPALLAILHGAPAG